MAAVKNK